MIEQKFKQTLKKIKLNKKEKILVALSGGKDSAVTAYLLKKFGYNIQGIHINLKTGKYSDDCLEAVEELCNNLKIKLYVYDIKKETGKTIKDFWKKLKKKNLNNCFVCGVFKKWILNKKARELKVDKIATGHNLDDEVQTFLINIFKGSPELSLNLGAITKNKKDKKFVSRIKPLFYIDENEIRKYSKKIKLPIVSIKCPYAFDSYRIQVREFVDTLNTKEKENIIKNSEKIEMKKEIGKANYCVKCGEPCRGKICKRCEFMK